VRDGESWSAPNGLQATVYISLDEESLIIDRVTRFDVSPEYVVLTTQRRERYAVEVEGVRALRFVTDAK